MNPSTLTLTLVTIVLWGVIPIFDKLALGQYTASPLLGIAIRSLAVGVVAIPLAASFGGGWPALKAMPPGAWVMFAASGLTSLLFAQYAYYALLKQADVSKIFPLLFSAAPVVTIVLAALFLRETMTLKQVLGALLVIGGGLLLL